MPATMRSHSTPDNSDGTGERSRPTMAAAKKPLTLDDLMKEIQKGTADAKANFEKLEGKIDANLLTITNDEAIQKANTRAKKFDN